MNAPAPAKQNELVGAILSRKYPLSRVIGSGGMGTVFESRNPEDGRAIAIKLLSVDYLHDLEVIQRFIEEGRVCQRLIHPNIVRVFETATAEDGTPYLVMELLEGVPLSAYTRSSVRVPIGQATAILQGVLAGLGAAHAQGIVHRDLKPENVVLAREASGTFTAKILDFGIAKVMDAAGGMGSKTKTGVLLGTPAYMSPEQIKNAKEVDARSDLWSAGVLLYEMLTGRVAFPAPTEYARLGAVLNATPAPIESIDPQLGRLSAFISLSMQKDRTQRYQSALEMARALTAASGETPSPAGPAPISRLPDVPSVFMAGTALRGSAPPTPVIDAHPTFVDVVDRGQVVIEPGVPDKGPGGTLASRPGRQVTDPPPQVVIASQGTLPSENLPMLMAHGARRGVAAWAVVVLVLGALVAGFLLGLATARLH
ncbi:MAG: serine/threonine protein kinase [Labilithrix sp.]|nr:serine/threonine protein kinase [Labilithrix sp.]MCW5811753.1 serine/threonine protein kinase [Labilithrix sp.]